ncbi:hypothetical protein NFX46_26910 [Streptomyces phaeoluteigriseus]|uniref:Uncharacterized protein n=1 Tax=Streptomyces phaeoluteigriseus TaxID=114686 RepID=A0ABY4ZFH4_9ACTN|nr:hypothetical protein [Streptomyces phaeoluteigriseus]USQ87027.1 hypothetical protein NFX46_26910 [Streptomyces phaeoluteigriseus]
MRYRLEGRGEEALAEAAVRHEVLDDREDLETVGLLPLLLGRRHRREEGHRPPPDTAPQARPEIGVRRLLDAPDDSEGGGRLRHEP